MTELDLPLPRLALNMANYTVGHFLFRPEDYFILDAPYQRGSVWTTEQKQALVKSLLLGLPIGIITVAKLPYKKDRGTYRVVDGKQRIEAMRAFVAGNLQVSGHWFSEAQLHAADYRDGLVTYSYLSQMGERSFENGSVATNEFRPDILWGYEASGEQKNITMRSDSEMLRAEAELYGLINHGGTPQTDADKARAAKVAAP